MNTAAAARRALETVFREERSQILAVLIRLTRDFSLAEDALQEAFAEALSRWPTRGVPPRPAAWITTTARRRAIDTLRRARTYRRKKVERALRRGRVGAYQVQAAIAALHAEAPSPARTDWPQIAALYTLMLRLQPSPVVELNRAVAIGMAAGPAAGLALVDGIAARGDLDGYHLLEAARAELLVRDGRHEEAERSYRRAIEQCRSPVERGYLRRRLAEAAEA